MICKGGIVFKSAAHHIETLWYTYPVVMKLYAKSFLDLKESTPHHLLFISLFSRFCQLRDQASIVSQLKPNSIEFYNYEMINRGFSHPTMNVICQHVFAPVTIEEFDVLVRGNIQKALLRNPELSIFHLEAMLRGIKIDMSQFSFEIVKTSSKHFLSTNAELRQTLVNAYASIISKTHDFGQLEVTISSLAKFLLSTFKSEEDVLRTQASDSLSYIAQLLPEAESVEIIQRELFTPLQGQIEWFEMHGICLALGACVRHSFSRLQKLDLENEVVNCLVQVTSGNDPRIISVVCVELARAMVKSNQLYPNALNLF